jgi:hypothetical protein
MIKSAELAGPSCLTESADDEPVFVLCARDPLAPNAVREWAFAYERRHGMSGPLTKRQEEKYTEALAIAYQMERWRTSHEQQTDDTKVKL